MVTVRLSVVDGKDGYGSDGERSGTDGWMTVSSGRIGMVVMVRSVWYGLMVMVVGRSVGTVGCRYGRAQLRAGYSIQQQQHTSAQIQQQRQHSSTAAQLSIQLAGTAAAVRLSARAKQAGHLMDDDDDDGTDDGSSVYGRDESAPDINTITIQFYQFIHQYQIQFAINNKFYSIYHQIK